MKTYLCTFCGYNGSLTHFLIKLRSGLYSKKQYRCPDCKNTMYRGTLLTPMSVDYWGAWVSTNLRLFGKKFSERMKWDKLKQRLNEYRIATEFWKGFNFVKDNYERLTEKQLDELSTLTYEPEGRQTKMEEHMNG